MNASLTIRNVLSGAVVEKLQSEIRNVIRTSSLTNNFRVYVDGIKHDNDLVNAAPPQKDEDISAWSKRVFRDGKFSIIINQCEQLSAYLANLLHGYLEYLQPIAGIPLLGYNSTIFMGNYGFTPLGVHHDGTGNNVLHFHIGPGDKVMYNWGEDVYTAEIKELSFGEQLEAADCFRFSAGDLYFMPWNKYHIGNTEDFSIGITLWFNNPTKASYLKKLNDDFFLPLIGNGESIIHAKEPFDSFGRLADNAQERRFGDLLGDAHRQAVRVLTSSANWNSKSIIDHAINLTRDDLLREMYVIKPYQIIYAVDRSDILVYTRGHKQVLPWSEALLEAIDRLNGGAEAFRVGDFIEGLSNIFTQRQAVVLLTDWCRKQIIELR